MTDSPLYFRQLLAGRDFAQDRPLAADMLNFVYLIGDKDSRECVVVDPAWDIQGILDRIAEDDMKLAGVLATHYHPDHIGGDLLGMAEVEGLRELLSLHPVPVHCQADETEWIRRSIGLAPTDLTPHESGDELLVGDVPVRLIHTPGHTPGSQCFLVGNRLVAGDTLFLQGCGRTDLPGGDPAEMYRSLHQRLAKLPDDTLLFPGHRYSPADSALLGDTRKTNQVFRVQSLDDWLRFMG
ncbi:MAG TPA: MBL fold metallo-hydrolase [Planctomycetes bacterium]|nr:MBL fold metallo-hydrolase [Planctomycetota bacterium]